MGDASTDAVARATVCDGASVGGSERERERNCMFACVVRVCVCVCVCVVCV